MQLQLLQVMPTTNTDCCEKKQKLLHDLKVINVDKQPIWQSND